MKRIFIGLKEIASFNAVYAKGFQTLGYETYTVIDRKNPYYPDFDYDVVLSDFIGPYRADAGSLKTVLRSLGRWIISPFIFIKAIFTCDVFIFLFGTSFLPFFIDYWILKSLGKMVVSVFLGTDIRYWYAVQQEMENMGHEQEIRPFLEYIKNIPVDTYSLKERRVRAAERWSDLILSQPDMAQLQTRPYMRVSVPLDLSGFQNRISDRDIPLVVHAPSNRGIKGTEYILEVVEKLKQEGIIFEFRLIENMPNPSLKALLSDADILVDDIFSVTIGVLALEAMASGNVVLARYLPEYSKIPEDCPAVNVSRELLLDKLREIILDPALREELASAGRPYVEEHYDHLKIVQQILDYLDMKEIDEFDFNPTFFQEDFQISKEFIKDERKKVLRYYWDRLKRIF